MKSVAAEPNVDLPGYDCPSVPAPAAGRNVWVASSSPDGPYPGIPARLVPILLPLLDAYPFLVKRGSLTAFVDSLTQFPQGTYLPYMEVITILGCVVLPATSMFAFFRWIVAERAVKRWPATRLSALLVATGAVVAQCEISLAWTVESPLSIGWPSLPLFFGAIAGPVVMILAPLATLAVLARSAAAALRENG